MTGDDRPAVLDAPAGLSVRPAPRVGAPWKIAVTGPYGAGKTTFIRTISDVTVLSTQRRVVVIDQLDDHDPADVTVAMDFGRLTTPDGLGLCFYGVPSGEHHAYLQPVLADGLLGWVLLLDDARPDCYEEAAEDLATFRRIADDAPFTVGVTHVRPGVERRAVGRVRHQLRLGTEVEVRALDARDREQVKALLVGLLLRLASTLDDRDPAATAAP